MSQPARRSLSFRIDGLDCAEEVAVLKGAVGPRVGGDEHLAFDILRGRMTVLEPEPQVSAEEIRHLVARTGMKAELWEVEKSPAAFLGSTEEGGARGMARVMDLWRRNGRTLLCNASGLLLVLAFAVQVAHEGSLAQTLKAHEGPGVPPLALFLYLASIVAGAWFVAPKAFYAARALRPDMNLLMIIAVAGAMGIGEWLEAASVAFLFSLALVLERWSVGRARRAIESLLELSANLARTVEAGSGETRERPVEEVEIGARVRVRPGEKIPLDGTVVQGRTAVDQASITGESIPVVKEVGDEVYAGTVNGDGAFDFQVTRAAQDTTLARIIHMVEEAQTRRAPTERWVERFARVYTPIMMVLAIAVATAPPLLAAAPWTPWFYRALVLLVIACPCALVISTPVSVVAGLSSAARSGVLIKGGSFLEAPAHFRAMAFDKTGTLTYGRPRVTRILPLDGHTEDELLARAAALEVDSNHPLARGVLVEAEERGIAVEPAVHLTSLPGRGAEGDIDGRRFWVGSHRLLEEQGAETPECHRLATEIEDAGQTLLAVGNDRHVCGLIAVADEVRQEAAVTLNELKSLGLRRLVMLTGDHHRTAKALAETLGVEDYRANLLPAEKVAAVAELQREVGSVAMVGDGVNDAPALAAASAGIAMGTAGSDAAIETADIALMSDDLTRLPWLIRHSRRTLCVIRQNIAFALGVKAAFIALAALGLSTLWMAIAADMGASLLVIANALRLLRVRA